MWYDAGMETRINTFLAIVRPPLVRVVLGLWAGLAGYDVLSSQFELPTIRAVWGMSGNLLPWLGWLLILQAIFVYALFEYVRRSPQSTGAESAPLVMQTSGADVEATLTPLNEALAGHGRVLESMQERLKELEDSKKYVMQRIRDVHNDYILEDKKLRSSFAALHSRERLAALSIQIERAATGLSQHVKAGEGYDKLLWPQWEATHVGWEAVMTQWVEVAHWYAPDVRERTLLVDEKYYAGTWDVTDAQFPNSEAVRRYKKFRIVQEQWERVRLDVEAGIIQVAFIGMAEEDMRRA